MSLRSMRTSEMVAVTSTWVTPEHADYQALARVPVLAALLPALIMAHKGLYGIFQAALQSSRLVDIQSEQQAVDFIHDNILRLVWNRLQSLLYLFPTDAAFQERLRRIILIIFPDGLSIVQRSYREEAGHAERVSQQLSAEDREFLAAIPLTGGGTLLDQVDAWIEAGRRLGQLDRERASVPGRNRSASIAARNVWARTVQMMRQNAEFAVADDSEIAELLERLALAERDADRRVAAGFGSGEQGDIGDGVDEADPALPDSPDDNAGGDVADPGIEPPSVPDAPESPDTPDVPDAPESGADGDGAAVLVVAGA